MRFVVVVQSLLQVKLQVISVPKRDKRQGVLRVDLQAPLVGVDCVVPLHHFALTVGKIEKDRLVSLRVVSCVVA